MEKPDPLLFSIQQLVVDFSQIDRNHYLAKTDQRESDSDHTLSLALLCWSIISRNNIDLDLSKIFKYALCHDLVEVYAGDVNTFATSEERSKKVEDERIALEKMSREFVDFDEMVAAMNGYEAKVDEEALFVWTVDKFQALILGDMDNWRPYQELGITYEQFCDKHNEQFSKCSPYCRNIFSDIFEYSKTTFYDRPKGD